MSAPKSPTPDQMDRAANWLDYYEDHGAGVDENKQACKVVAEWLRVQSENKELQLVAKEHGIPVKKLRASLKKVNA